MRTDALIGALAADAGCVGRRGPVRRALLWGVPVLLVVAAVAMAVLGPRADFRVAMTTAPTLAKWLLPLIVALAAGAAALIRARPEERTPHLLRYLLIGVGLVALGGIAMSLVSLPVSAWATVAGGRSAGICLIAIPVLAIAPLAAAIAALRSGASSAPMTSGALAGLAAGGAAATVYAMQCHDDAPLFFLLWYSLGILVSGAMGALAGRRWLTW